MNPDIEQVHAQCRHCNEGAPSNSREPLAVSPEPEYPWQQAVLDFFESAAHKYLVIADRFTGWPELSRQNGKAMTLVRTCRNVFAQFGVPEELSFDGGPPFDSHEWKRFLIQWDIFPRLSSANYPQSNGRAELAVKSCKRLLYGNTDAHGSVDCDGVMKALLQYRNTPSAITGMSPAFMLFGRLLRDALPSTVAARDPATMSYFEKYGGRPSPVWDDVKKRREIAYAKKKTETEDRYNRDKHCLAPLSVGDSVSIQNRSGPHPLRWERTGAIVERLANRQYLVKSDGSGRVLLRTRTHLRKIEPTTRNRSIHDVGDVPHSNTGVDKPRFIPGSLQDGTQVIDSVAPDDTSRSPDERDAQGHMPLIEDPRMTPDDVTSDDITAPSIPIVPSIPTVRRSARNRNPTPRLSPTMHGKHHGTTTLK